MKPTYCYWYFRTKPCPLKGTKEVLERTYNRRMAVALMLGRVRNCSKPHHAELDETRGWSLIWRDQPEYQDRAEALAEVKEPSWA